LASPTRSVLVVAAALAVASATARLAAETRSGQDSPGLMRVGAERAALLALPKSDGAPTLAELLAGTAVRVIDRQDGFARVVVEGWIPEPALVELPPLVPTEPEPAPPPVPEPPPPPVRDLALAHHVGVTAAILGTGKEREVELTLELETMKGNPVVVEGTRHAGKVRVFEQKRIAGGRTRGPELAMREVTFEAGRASLRLPLSALGEKPPGTLLVSASAELSATRTVYGAATDVVVGGDGS